MRITRIHVEGFGVLRDRTYRLDGPLTLFYGRNEAGKSTLMGFLRAVLFGFPARGPGGSGAAQRYEPLHGGAHGGSLTLIDDQGRELLVERYDRARTGRGRSAAGIVKVTLADGTTGGEELLQTRLGGISAELFRSLFAFGLTELQELRTLQTEEISGYLYSAGLGRSGSLIMEAERRLGQRMDQLYRPKGKNQDIPLTLQAVAELESSLRKSKEHIGKYEAWTLELQRLDERIRRLDLEKKRLRAERDWWNACLKARPYWISLREIEDEAAQLPVFDTFPEDALKRWETLTAERETVAAHRERLRIRREHLQHQLEELQIDERILTHRAELDDLLERMPLFRQNEREALLLQTEARHQEEQLKQLLRHLDEEWTVETLKQFPVSVGLRERIRSFRERFASEQRQLDRITDEHEQALAQETAIKEQRNQSEKEIAALSRQMALTYPWTAEEVHRNAAEDPVQLLRRIRSDYSAWLQLHAELEHQRERAEDARRNRELLAKEAEERQRETASSMWKLTVFSAAMAVGFSAFLFFTRQTIAAAAAFLLLSVFTYVLFRVRHNRVVSDKTRRGRAFPVGDERSKDDLPEHQTEQIRTLRENLEYLQRQLQDRIRRLTSLPDSSAAAEWVTAPESGRERYVPPAAETVNPKSSHAARTSEHAWAMVKQWLDASLDEWERLADRWQQEQAQLQRKKEKLDDLRQAAERQTRQRLQLEEKLRHSEASQRQLQREWAAWLEEHRLKPHLSPDAAFEALQLIEQGQALLEQLTKTAHKLTSLQSQNRAITERVANLLSAGAEDPLTALKQWKEEANRQMTLMDEQKRLQTELGELEQERQLLDERDKRLEQRIAELLTEAHALDEEQFRLHVRQHDRRVQLQESKRSILITLEAWLGKEQLSRLDDDLQGKDEAELSRAASTAEQQLTELEEEENRLRDQRGRLAAELETLETGSEHADKLQQLQEQLALLQRQAEEWAVLSLTSALFRKTRELYERERQPQVLKRASGYFAQMTGGQFTRIVAPVGEQRLIAMRANGQAVDPAQLSRGTAEQLYLAMRFALAGEYARQAALPLIMDDILVNFDRERTERTLSLLQELSGQHQILLFTCHPHIVSAAAEILPGHRLIEL